jgi:hypothetical protein
MKTFIFQSNPDEFDIDSYLADSDILTWTIRQEHYIKQISIGDVVYLWRAQGKHKRQAGIIAEARVVRAPYKARRNQAMSALWKRTPKQLNTVVDMELVRVAGDSEMLRRETLLTDRVLKQLTILRMRTATNYLVPPELAGRLHSLWQKSGKGAAPNNDGSVFADVRNDWRTIVKAAQKALNHNAHFESPIHKRPYRVMKIGGEGVWIERLNGGRPALINEDRVTRGMAVVQTANGKVPRRSLARRVAEEAAIVFLHPDLTWSADMKYIVREGSGGHVSPTYTGFGKAPPNDPEQLQTFARRVRNGQPKFRAELLKVYGGKCCITGDGPEEVLDACHIEDHATSGKNQIENGLLLRADLHNLFDCGLLQIDAVTLKVKIHAQLKTSPYFSLNGQRLRNRADGKRPSKRALSGRFRLREP